jgi:hypothetical protein
MNRSAPSSRSPSSRCSLPARRTASSTPVRCTPLRTRVSFSSSLPTPTVRFASSPSHFPLSTLLFHVLTTDDAAFLPFLRSAGGKFDELTNDDSVNVSFSDPSSTDWASAAGKASVVKDLETFVLLPFYLAPSFPHTDSPLRRQHQEALEPYHQVGTPPFPISPIFLLPNSRPRLCLQWFGDLKDGVRTGEPGDPRIAVIEVVPAEIRYWVKTRTSLGQQFEVLKGAVTGETAAPGHLRVVNASDVSPDSVLFELYERALTAFFSFRPTLSTTQLSLARSVESKEI